MSDEKKTLEARRVTAEHGREAAEDVRDNAEASRVSAESRRMEAEQFRVIAEQARAIQEQHRIELEEIRQAREQGATIIAVTNVVAVKHIGVCATCVQLTFDDGGNGALPRPGRAHQCGHPPGFGL